MGNLKDSPIQNKRAKNLIGNAKDSHRLAVRFWGVRGSVPTPDPESLKVGGNTTCVELKLPNEELLIVDGGTGVRNLGLHLCEQESKRPLKVNFLMTHFHWDHIQGLPFFLPLYGADNEVTFHSVEPPDKLKAVLHGQMTTPYFPVDFNRVAAKRSFVQIPHEGIQIGGVLIEPFPLHHPQGAYGYRFSRNGAIIVHASDHEHGHERTDLILEEHARDADILIYDAQFTPEEYASKQGWGHSTWTKAVELVQRANVKHLILFHHDPGHDDIFMQGIEEQARREFPRTTVAREGLTITL
jgi:phosphoribosyl 1,2-cyclic phosphodiesterase